jgi:putative hydrolase of the HAD superfamily
METLQPALERHFLTQDCSLEDAVVAFCRDTGLGEPKSLLQHYQKSEPTLFPDTLPVLERLARQGVRLITLSNCTPWEAGGLDRLSLGDFFEGHFYSFRIGAAKPNPVIFQAVEKALGLPPKAFFHIGDSWKADVLGAKACGWRTAFLQRKGVGNSSSQRCDIAILDSLRSLPHLLERDTNDPARYRD